MRIIDLRSDTVTRPTKGMMDAIVSSPVGDDVLGDDPTVKKLEAYAAERFGVENALFCVSGTQANQIALMSHLSPGDEVICHHYAHIYNFEGGGIAANAHASVRLVGDDLGIIHPDEVVANINPNNEHHANTRVLAVENTSNKGGGTCYSWERIEELRAVAEQHGLTYHLDGARLYNALVATGQDESDYGAAFDSISVCMSKGLGAPIGAILLGSKDFIHHSRRIRKRIGGGMRQAGYMAGAALYAIENNIERLAEDHAAASEMAAFLNKLPYVHNVVEPQSNILIFGLKADKDQGAFVASLQEKGILISQMGPGKCRMVFHLDVTMDDVKVVQAALAKLG